MEQGGLVEIRATRAAVWSALNDPEILRQCIDGCESFEATGAGQFTAIVRARVGPVSATFKGEIRLKDLVAPESYTLIGNGAGGVAGFARGEAHVSLRELAQDRTALEYDLTANVGGKLAQVGSRLVDGAARKMAEDFFARFRQLVESPASTQAEVEAELSASADRAMAAATGVESHASTRYEPTGQSTIWWIVFAVLGLALLLAML